MINWRFVLSPGTCGYFCLKHVMRKKILQQSYMSLYEMKGILISNGYYCSCVKVNNIFAVKGTCITLIKNKDGSNHYVVIKKLKTKNIWFYDPLFVCIRRMRITKFIKKWSNICLIYTKV